MNTFTIIAYRKNKTITSLGCIREGSHDSELSVHTFMRDGPEIDTFLQMTALEELRKKKENPDLQPIEFTLIKDGITTSLNCRVLDAQDVAERMFEAEEIAAKRVQELERARARIIEAQAKRAHDISELKRILNTYPIQELRDEVIEL